MMEKENLRSDVPPLRSDFVIGISRGLFYRLLVIVAFILLVFYATRILLVAFVGILLAVLLRTVANWIAKRTHLNGKAAFLLTLLAACGLFAAAGYLLGPRLVTQLHDLAQALPKSLASMKNQLGQYDWGRDLTREINNAVQPSKVANKVNEVASGTVQWGVSIIAVLAIALFVGADPDVYVSGMLQLAPEESRGRVKSLLDDLAFTIRWWLLGQLVPMIVLGAGTMLGLWLLGIPLAFTLGLLTAAMLFVPYAGSVIAYIPTALIALTMSFRTLLWVTILYVGVHLAEGYIITPLVQRRAVKLPPALTLFAQLLMWEFAGVLGVFAATPLTAAALTLVKRVYLKEPPERHGK